MLELHACKAVLEVPWLMVDEFAIHLGTETRIMVYWTLSFATIKLRSPLGRQRRGFKISGSSERRQRCGCLIQSANECFFKCVCGVFLHRVIGGVGE